MRARVETSMDYKWPKYGAIIPDEDTVWYDLRCLANSAVDNWNEAHDHDHFIFSEFNPDACQPNELREWYEYIDEGLQRGVDRSIFPELSPEASIAAAVDFALYCLMKFKAIEHRLAGRINIALALEAFCEISYGKLPESVRW